VGTGRDATIAQLAEEIKNIVGFDGDIKFDASMPDGTPRKLLDVSRLTQLGWQYTTELRDGLAATYEWYLSNVVASAGRSADQK
jgi:GDP-L-fucose synthase